MAKNGKWLYFNIHNLVRMRVEAAGHLYLLQVALQNLKTAKGYSKEILRARKTTFYAKLRTIATDLKEKKT